MPNLTDVYLAVGLFAVAVVVYLTNRVGVLPKKSIPVIVGAIAGALGFTLLRRWQGRAADAQIDLLKDRIAKRDVIIKDLETKHNAAESEFTSAKANLERQLAAAQKQRMQILTKDTTEKERIDGLTLDETSKEYEKALREEAEYQASKRRVPAPAGGE